MLLIVLMSAIAIALIITWIVMHEKCDWSNWEIPCVFGIIALIAAIIMIGIAVNENIYKDVNIEIWQQRHDALVLQYNENFYNKITYDGRQDLMDQIIGYNKTVTLNRAKHVNIWVSAFYPEDWDSLPLIELRQEG